MSELLYLATSTGVVAGERADGGWHIARRALEGQFVTSVTARGNVVVAGTRDGIWRSTDRGETWGEASTGLSIRHIRWIFCPPKLSHTVLAGTEAAGIFVSEDDGVTWHGRPEVEKLRDQHNWFLPYSPEAGCVRGFTAHSSTLYAAVEVGGALRSQDGGQTWGLVEGSDGEPNMSYQPPGYVHPDVHSISVHPSSSDWITAPTGGGLYRSTDGGKTWARLYTCYCRAAWVDPMDHAHIIFGPADGVSRNGRIEETLDGGQNWRVASGDLQVPWPRHMVERFTQVGDELLAVLSNGQLLSAPVETLQWQQILAEVEGIKSVVAVER